jgi:hypothetical protein
MGRPAHLICSISACPVCTDLPTAAQKQNPPKSPTLPPPPPPPFFLVRLRRSRSLLLAAYRPRPLPQPSHRRRRHVSEQSLPAPPLRYAEKASLLSRKNFFDPPGSVVNSLCSCVRVRDSRACLLFSCACPRALVRTGCVEQS